MDVQRKHKLCTDIYKTLNNLNPSFMKEIFQLRLCSGPVREQYKLKLNISRKRQVTFGTKTLESFGPKHWNNLRYHIKSAKNLNVFKNLIKKWILNYIDDFCVIFVNFLVDKSIILHASTSLNHLNIC